MAMVSQRQTMNYFEVLGLSIDDLQGKDEATVKSLVNTAHKKLYALTIGAYAYVPRLDGRTQAEWQQILNKARATLIDPQMRQEHIEGISQKTEFVGMAALSEVKTPDERQMGSKVVGIDLGMRFSAIAYVNEDGEPEIIPNAEGQRRTPSVIMFEDDLVIVGEIAKQTASAVPEQIVEFINREMGKSKEEFFREFDGKEYSAEELSALILRKLKQDAEAYLNTEITDVVIMVPAYFHDAEREATRNAGRIAGLNVLQVINESTAAAFAYGIHLHGSDQNVLVFNLGGGTFDATIMKVPGSEMQIIATNGDHRLGGKDWMIKSSRMSPKRLRVNTVRTH